MCPGIQFAETFFSHSCHKGSWGSSFPALLFYFCLPGLQQISSGKSCSGEIRCHLSLAAHPLSVCWTSWSCNRTGRQIYVPFCLSYSSEAYLSGALIYIPNENGFSLLCCTADRQTSLCWSKAGGITAEMDLANSETPHLVSVSLYRQVEMQAGTEWRWL